MTRLYKRDIPKRITRNIFINRIFYINTHVSPSLKNNHIFDLCYVINMAVNIADSYITSNSQIRAAYYSEELCYVCLAIAEKFHFDDSYRNFISKGICTLKNGLIFDLERFVLQSTSFGLLSSSHSCIINATNSESWNTLLSLCSTLNISIFNILKPMLKINKYINPIIILLILRKQRQYNKLL